MKPIHIAPKMDIDAYTCPHCGTKSQVHHCDVRWGNTDISRSYIFAQRCITCNNFIVWVKEILVYPKTNTGIPDPSNDMPGSVLELYNEAREIVNGSPRASCALLRVAVEKLCHGLGVKKQNLQQSIAALIKNNNLPFKIQKALEVVRIAGNDAVHPGQIVFDADSREVAIMMFNLINIITTHIITENNEIDKLHELVEQSKPNACRKAE